MPQFFFDALKRDDVAVYRRADGQDQTCQTGQGEHRAQTCQNAEDKEHHQPEPDGQNTAEQGTVINQNRDDNRDSADERRSGTGVDRILPQGRTDGADFLYAEFDGQATAAKN